MNLRVGDRGAQFKSRLVWPLVLGSLISGVLLVRCASRSLSISKSAEITQPIRMEMFSREDNPDVYANPSVKSPKLVWISLDGLTASLIDDFIARQRKAKNSLHPFGLSYMRERLTTSRPVQITDATITAASHTSTITCSNSFHHGIVGNSIWNGELSESGFEKPYQAQTFIHALRQSGLKVASVGYPGFDHQTDNRVADFSMAYNSNRNSSQFIELLPGMNQEIQIADDSNLSESRFSIQIQTSSDPSQVEIIGPNGEHLGRVQPEIWSDLVIHLPQSTRMASMRVFGNTLYIAATSQNRIHPASLRQELDNRGYVFPAGKDFEVQNRFGDEAFLATMEHRLNHFTFVAHTFLEQPDLDAVFLYFEDLDVLGHSFSGYESKQAIVDAHLARFDRYLGSVLSRIGPDSNLVIVGDHGMTAVNMVLNPIELVPKHLRNKIVLKASGGTLWAYGPKKENLVQGAPTHESWFEELTESLSEATLPGEPRRRIFTSVHVIDDTARKQSGAAPDLPLPWIQATVATDMGLRVSVEPGLLSALRAGTPISKELRAQSVETKDGKLPEPLPPGQHGHLSSEPSMLTHLFARGPALESALRLPAGSSTPLLNTRLVPKVAQALSWPAPEACR